jgi:hypothetical protein
MSVTAPALFVIIILAIDFEIADDFEAGMILDSDVMLPVTPMSQHVFFAN